MDVNGEKGCELMAEKILFHQSELERVTTCGMQKSIISSVMEDSGYSTASLESFDCSREQCSCSSLLSSDWQSPILPILPPQLTMRKPEEQKVDMIAMLSGYPHLLHKLLSFLKPDDLVRLCLVSKHWCAALKSDESANSRRIQFLTSKDFKNKENIITGAPCKVQRSLLPETESRMTTSTPLVTLHQDRRHINPTVFPDVSSLAPALPVVKDRFTVFVEQGKKLPPGRFQMRCPRCSLPSQVTPETFEGLCCQPSCCFHFCIKCLCQQHGNSPCVVNMENSPIKPRLSRVLKSRSCRRQLRRL